MSVRSAEGAGAAGSEAKERRVGGLPRIHFEALVAVGETAGGGFEAESVDVSPDGMRLRTAFLPDVGDKLVCRFDGMGNEVVADGEVIWRNEEAKGGEFGLRFTGLDGATEEAMRAMCASLNPAEEPAAAEEPCVPRGSRVRLHIEGLGSPMKARVRESAARELEVGSNLEFLKVGRSLELEDVDKGEKREAMIDSVKVDVDPATNVPQLVVTLRYEKAGASVPPPAKKKARASTPPATRRTTAPEAAAAPATTRDRADTKTMRSEVKAEEAAARAAEAEAEDEGQDDAEQAPGFGARAASAGRAVAGKLGPAITGIGARAKGAMGGMMAIIEKRRAERAETQKPATQRRTTAPPPGGALTSDGRRLVRDDGLGDEEDAAAPPRTNRRAAAIGGALGLIAVLAIFGMTRLAGGHAHPAVAADARAAATALPAGAADAPGAAGAPGVPGAASGTPVANLPFYGATPLSTTELVAPAAPSASAQASAAPGAPGAPDANGDDDEPGDGKQGPILKEWGKGTVSPHPVVLRIKMDGAIERITGAAGAQGFTISVPGHRSTSTSTGELSKKDKRLSAVNVVNTSRGAEVSIQFKDDVPAYIAKVKGDKLEISIGKEGHSKIAKKKKKKSSH
jgi:hypothetical protein